MIETQQLTKLLSTKHNERLGMRDQFRRHMHTRKQANTVTSTDAFDPLAGRAGIHSQYNSLRFDMTGQRLMVRLVRECHVCVYVYVHDCRVN